MNTKMIIFVVNLKTCVDRKKEMENQLKKLGLPYMFVEAVYGKALSQEEKDSLCDYKKIYRRYHRILTDGEIGCALSHKKIYQFMIDNNIEKAIVLEDDVLLKDNFTECYNELKNFTNNNFLIKLNADEENDKYKSPLGIIRLNKFILRKNVFNFWSTASYYIDLQTAKTIMKNHPKIDSVSDDYLRYLAKNVKLRLSYPSCVNLNEQVKSTLETDRTISNSENTNKENFSDKIRYYLKRISQFIVGYFNPFN